MKSPHTLLPLERSPSDERGSALIIVMIVIMMLMLLAVAVSGVSVTRSKSALETREMVPAQGLAEAGIAAMLDQVQIAEGQAGNGAFDPILITTTEGTISVTSVDVGNDTVQVISTGTTARTGSVVRIEAFLKSDVHVFANKAIYVGDKDAVGTDLQLGPDNMGDANPSGNEEPETFPYVSLANSNDWQVNFSQQADYIHGDIYVNGHVRLKGNTTVWGDIDTTDGHIHGDIVGSPFVDPATGTQHVVSTDVDPIDPPSLATEDYQNPVKHPETIILSDNTSIPADLAEVFYQGRAGTDGLYTSLAGVQDDSRIWHLGPNGGGNGTIEFDPAQHNGKIFYVKGNLWLHSSSFKILRFPNGEDVQVTIVVEGNFYISDDLNYGTTAVGTNTLTNSGMLLIAKGTYTAGADGINNTADDDLEESFVDEDKDYVYDPPNDGPDGIPGNGDDFPGEPIINDHPTNGTIGTYDGRPEGIGNIYFGDASYGTGGVTNGFMYAENNSYLTQPPGNVDDDLDKIYGVYGFLSAGGILDLGLRQSGSQFRNYKVMYNSALADGSLGQIKGIPKGNSGGFQGLEVMAWRIMAAGE